MSGPTQVGNLPNTYTLQKLYYHTCGNQSARDIIEFCNVNMNVG